MMRYSNIDGSNKKCRKLNMRYHELVPDITNCIISSPNEITLLCIVYRYNEIPDITHNILSFKGSRYKEFPLYEDMGGDVRFETFEINITQYNKITKYLIV